MTTVGSTIPAARLTQPRSSPRWFRRSTLRHPVVVATLLAAVLNLVWAVFLAREAGDLSAQYAWAGFARRHPGSAYNLSWYGGMHTASYSVLSPYLMGLLGVRTAAVLAGTASAALGAQLLVRSGAVRRPMAPALWTAFALWCDVASGRATFAIGMVPGLAATVVAFTSAGPRLRRTTLAVLAALATMGSPVVGLLLEVVAAALFLTGRRRDSYPVFLAPAVVVAGTTILFPFSGIQPFSSQAALPVVAAALAVAWLTPRAWAAVRGGACVYALGALLVWLIPSPVGSNVERLSLLFAGTALLSILTSSRQTRRRTATTVVGFLAVAGWLTGRTIGDLVATVPVPAAAQDGRVLIGELRAVGADRGRVEVVPLATHWEAGAIAPYVDLARGWNRQVDVTRNPLFYSGRLTAADYHAWLLRWGVGYVALPAGRPEGAAVQEAALVAAGQPWLRKTWQDGSWTLYRVADAAPLAAQPAEVEHAGAATVTITVPAAGPVRLLVPWSPWLRVTGQGGRSNGCLAKDGNWTLLQAPGPGTYEVTGNYSLPHAAPCPRS